ncbi:hypothetical protein VTO42DRAFT_4768 [Malbranchea cinnamomea]
MVTTPPPPSTIEVPSAPRHGAGFGFPLRRSERLASQRLSQARYSSPGLESPNLECEGSLIQDGTSLQQGHGGDGEDGALSITGLPQKKSRRTTGKVEARSPPHSPSYHAHDQHTTTTSSLGSSCLTHNTAEPTNQSINITAGMLPTPAKTPRKKTISDPGLASRALFTSRSNTLQSEGLAPKRTKGKKFSHFSLESFHSDLEEPNQHPPLEVYTDSRDRIPKVNQRMDNPFLRKATKGAGSMDGADDTINKERKVASEEIKRDKEVEKAIHRDDGLLYVFRGKKVFRKFKPEVEDEEDDDEDLGLLSSRPELLDGSPLPRVRPLTRSSIKPRILFPAAGQSARRKEDEVAVNENDEVPGDQDSESQVKSSHTTTATHIADDNPPTTPKTIDVITPPSPLASGRSLRSHARKEQVEQQATPCEVGESAPKRFSPFDRWWRTKRASTPTNAKKRAVTSVGEKAGREAKKLRGASARESST